MQCKGQYYTSGIQMVTIYWPYIYSSNATWDHNKNNKSKTSFQLSPSKPFQHPRYHLKTCPVTQSSGVCLLSKTVKVQMSDHLSPNEMTTWLKLTVILNMYNIQYAINTCEWTSLPRMHSANVLNMYNIQYAINTSEWTSLFRMHWTNVFQLSFVFKTCIQKNVYGGWELSEHMRSALHCVKSHSNYKHCKGCAQIVGLISPISAAPSEKTTDGQELPNSTVGGPRHPGTNGTEQDAGTSTFETATLLFS